MDDKIIQHLRLVAPHFEDAKPLMRAAAARIEALQADRDDYAAKLMAANDTYTEMHLALETAEAEMDAAVMAEREACAEVAEDHTPEKHGGALASHVTGKAISNAIRARSNKEPDQ